jgi:hypothetical protein
VSAVLLALFDRYSDAERVRTALVKEGFPTDRVDLSSSREPGRAAVEPAESARGKFAQYYGTLLQQQFEGEFVQELADSVAAGRLATVAVHPRGDAETERATQLLEKHQAAKLLAADLTNQRFERAASPDTESWFAHAFSGRSGEPARFYLRVPGEELK